MWQSPDVKRRAQMEAQRACKAREKKKNGLRLRKTFAELRAHPPEEQPVRFAAQILLNDITATGMRLLCDYGLPIGEFVQINLSEPRQVYVRARVTFCEELQNEHRVISVRPFPFRTSVVFLFSSEEEERDFKVFVEEVERELQKVSVAA